MPAAPQTHLCRRHSRLLPWLLTVLCMMLSTSAWAVSVKEARAAIKVVKKKQPASKKLFKKAYAYVVFPSVARGAFGLGGAFGEGIVFRKGKAIARSKLTQVTIGLGAGGENYVEVILFKTKEAFKAFKAGKLELNAQANAVANDQGVSAKMDFVNNVAIVTVTKQGLMANASVGGQVLSYDPL